MKQLIKQIQNNPFYLILKNIFTLNNEINYAPTSLTYYLIFSLIPAHTFLIFILNLLDIAPQSDIALINKENQLIMDYIIKIESQTSIFSIMGFIFSFFITIYISSRGIENFFLYCNRTYKYNTDHINFFVRKIKVILITIVIIISLSFLIYISSFIISFFKAVFPPFIAQLLNQAITFIGFLTFLTLLYSLSPLKKKKPSQVFLGASIAACFITIGINIYTIYANNFAKYDNYYGSISSLIIFLFTLYILSYCLLLGVQINMQAEKKLSKINKDSLEQLNFFNFREFDCNRSRSTKEDD